MENARDLLRDADTLLTGSMPSPGRARSLVILALEEIGKAEAICRSCAEAWDDKRPNVLIPGRVLSILRNHGQKIEGASTYGHLLPLFWSPTSPWDHELTSNEPALPSAGELNRQKQAGFYVDRNDETISTPNAIESNGVNELLERTAGVALMHLIEDHTRRQDLDDPLYESTNGLQMGFIMLGGAPL